jgi:peptidoglycan/LPS O-acetylase OafA/YrhL
VRSPNIAYLPGIDELRAYAATLMVSYHGLHLFSQELLYGDFVHGRWIEASSPFTALVIEGHTAVALFMTLSGFIFATASLSKQVRYGPFIRNRFLRIFPLFIAVLTVGLYGTARRVDFGSIVATVLPLSNTPAAFGGAPFTNMFWTIAVEFQFYLLFPFLLAFVQRDGPAVLFKIIAFFLLMRVAAVLAGASSRDLPYWTIVGRIDQFCLGMWFAWAYARRRYWFRHAGPQLAVAVATVLLLLFAFNRAGGWPVVVPWKLGFHTVEAAAWGYLIVCYLAVASRIPSVVSRAICYVGSISYSMYLLHFIVIDLMVRHKLLLRLAGDPFLDAVATTVLVALPVVLAVSTLSYQAIELPFLNMRGTYLVDRPDETRRAA